MEPEELVTLLKRFYVEARNVEGNPTVVTLRKQFARGSTDFCLVLLKGSLFPLSGIKCLKRQTKPLMPRSKILRDMG